MFCSFSWTKLIIHVFFFSFQKKRVDTRNTLQDEEMYRPTTTPYPHQQPRSPDPIPMLPPNFMRTSSSISGVESGDIRAYVLSGNVSDSLASAVPGLAHSSSSGPGCEIHMDSSFSGPVGIGPAGGTVPLHYGQHCIKKLPYGLNWLRPVILCCSTRSLLTKFPSRAKRIDVISRVIFPMIFAIFNLVYWLYYLFAKSKLFKQWKVRKYFFFYYDIAWNGCK